MTTVQRASNDSSGCSQQGEVFQLPNSISLEEMRDCMAGTYVESRHSAPEVRILHSAPEVYIPVMDWNSSSALSQSERKPAYLLTPPTSWPAWSASPSPARKFSRFSAQNFTEVFGNRLQTEANDQNRTANNRASYDKFRTRSAHYDRYSSFSTFETMFC